MFAFLNFRFGEKNKFRGFFGPLEYQKNFSKNIEKRPYRKMHKSKILHQTPLSTLVFGLTLYILKVHSKKMSDL